MWKSQKNIYSYLYGKPGLLLTVLSLGFLISLQPGCNGVLEFPPPGSNGDTVNTSPVADPGPDQTVFVGDLVVLDGSNSFDPDGDPLFYSWEQVGGPPVFLDTPEEPITTFFADVEGVYEFILTVDDGLGGVDAFNVFVEAVPF